MEALKDDIKKKAEIATQMLQAGLSINEVRTRVWEEEASDDPGANDPFVLVQQRSSIVNVSAEPEDVPRETSEERSVVAPAAKIQDPRVEEIRKMRTKQLDEEEGRTINALSQTIIDLLVQMTEKAIDVIEASDRKILAQKDLPSRRVLSRRINRALQEFESTWTEEHGRQLSTSVDLGYDQGLDLVFNAQARQEVQALRERDEEDRRLTLQARGLDSFAQISETHTERIMRQVEESQEKNESINDTMRRVANTLGTPGQLAGRAETIARTETLTAVSIGQGAVMANAKEVIPGIQKTWLTAGDARVRDSHVALDGDTIDVDEKFANGLSYPRDVNSSDASEVINCRCTLLLIPPEE